MANDTPRPTIRAIETRYAGHLFRSRLEARWAVFFDALSIEWQYEPQGFVIHDMGDEQRPYLPDFFLPRQRIWVEVKGAAERAEFGLYAAACDAWSASHLPHVTDDADKRLGSGLLVLGEVPKPGIRWAHPMFRHHKGVNISYGEWRKDWEGSPARFEVLPLSSGIGTGSTYISSSNEWDAIPLHGFACGGMQTWPSWEDTVLTFVQRAHVSAALTAAREARFEHGEAPRITSPRITPPRLDPPRLG